jgi:hypothetical protein
MNDRLGEDLWYEWDGELYENSSDKNNLYYTFEHIDVDNDVVKRALASSIQRDGLADSLGDAFKMIENSCVVYGWAGTEAEEIYLNYCDSEGETKYGDILENIKEVTFVEF